MHIQSVIKTIPDKCFLYKNKDFICSNVLAKNTAWFNLSGLLAFIFPIGTSKKIDGALMASSRSVRASVER
jgi:hypothetical protein